MLTRRSVLGWVAASALAAGRGRSLADPARPPGEVFDERTGAPLRVLRRAVFSVSNANDRFVGWVELAGPPSEPPLLAVATTVLRAGGWGSDASRGTGTAIFHVDRAGADALAALWHVMRQDRRPLGAGLVGRWRPRRQPFAVGAPMEIVLAVENAGRDAVGVSIGGRNRGVRDNRFAFVVERQGQTLPVVDAYDFGGLMYYKELKPGDTAEVSADLAAWTNLDAAGPFRVRCRYEAELVPGTESPSWPARAHETWDLTLAGAIDVVVA